MQFETLHLADANERRFHVCVWDREKQGHARPPIVMLHESLGTVDTWRNFSEKLARIANGKVVAYDRPGFGKSESLSCAPALSFISDEASASLLPLLDSLDIEKAILFGHSVGGGMAVCAAAQFPDRIAAVITESAQAFVEDRTREGIIAAKHSFADPAQLARLAKYHDNDLVKTQWVLDAWTETWLSPDFAGWNLDEALRKLQCPVLALHGDQDEYGSALHPQRIAGLPSAFAGQGECVMLEDCRHVPHREKPELVLEAVAKFLDKHFPER